MPTTSPSTPAAYAPPGPSTPTAPATCRNCASPLTGVYCQHCGQRDAPPDPTLPELAGDVVEQLLNLDGRIAATFAALLRHPGRLTLDFLSGRRAPYLSPLRVYLTCSVVYFGIAALTPPPLRTIAARTGSSEVRFEIPGIVSGDAAATRRALDGMRRSPSPLTRYLGGRAERVIAADPQKLKRRADDALPKLMFALVPIFAALTVTLFRRRFRYPAHLVFAMHVHAFAFLALILIQLGEWADRLAAVLGATAVAWAVVLGYLGAAVRRVFAPSLVGAVVGTFVLAVAYGVVLSLVQLLYLAVVVARL